MENKLKDYTVKELLNNIWGSSPLANNFTFYKKSEVDELLRQFERPVVPQFVADGFEYMKHNMEHYLIQMQERIYNNQITNSFDEWFSDINNEPYETLIKMKLFGYEVEKEKRWYVHFVKSDNTSYLNINIHTCETSTDIKIDSNNYTAKFTEAEIKAINPAYWNEAFLEEVEE